MRREAALIGAIVLVVLGSSLAVVAVPGVVATPQPPDVRPGRLDVRGMNIAPGDTSGSSATLAVTTVLRHRGGRSENVSLRLEAVDLDSGMIATTAERPVDPVTGDREVRVTVNITVPREGGYRINSILYRDGMRIDRAVKDVRGVGTLTPEYAETPVQFHRVDAGGGRLPSVQFSVVTVRDNRSTLSLSTYLTNQGDAPSGELAVEFIVRQADSNIVAARRTVPVSEIRPGRTVTPGTEVTVPAAYNYYLDAILLKDGVIVGAARSAANLNPTDRISANTTVREVGLRVSEFEAERDAEVQTRTVAGTAQPAAGQPGFGVTVAIVAVIATAVIAWRRRT